jgi:PleD family two-component response regulator
MENRMYSLSEAADVADVPLDELRRAIKDGLIAAKAFQNTGEVHVAADELARYVRRTRHADPFGHQKKRKILLLGEDLLFAGTLKLELQRDPRMDVRYASWGKDALLMVHHYNANLFVVDLTPSKAVPDEVLAAIHSQRAETRSPIIAYSSNPDDPLVQQSLKSLAPEQSISKSRGLRAVTILCFQALGLDTSTKIFRLHG